MSQSSSTQHTILVTGATGQLGRLTIQQLRARGARVIAGVRDTARAAELGVESRTLDYDHPETLAAALAGVDRLLLISGNAVGQRVRQHGAVITAAKAAGVKLIAYTSALRADVSPLGLAVEHKATEELLAASGVPFVVLRNGWYVENFLDRAKAGAQFGEIGTCAGQGRFSAATRADFAEGTAAVLISADGHAGKKLELGGSTGFTMDEFAAMVSRISGKPVRCRHLDQAGYKASLVQVGLPEFVAEILANSDASAAGGWLEDNSRTLEKLIGHPTTTMASVLEGALK